jgi:hypothetical protein
MITDTWTALDVKVVIQPWPDQQGEDKRSDNNQTNSNRYLHSYQPFGFFITIQPRHLAQEAACRAFTKGISP